MSKRYLWQDLRDWLQLHYAERFARCELFVNPAADGTGPQGYYKLDFSGVLLNDGSPIRHDIEIMAVSYAVAWYAGHNSAANTADATDWILCSEQLPPYDEVVWLTHAASHAWGKPVPAHEQCWRVERGQRHATNKHGEIWWRAGISGEMAWEVFSWMRSAQPALDTRARK